MEHHFNIEDAKKYGVECAVILNNIKHWSVVNKANNNNFHEGKYWTYNSVNAFTEIFPYLTKDKIRRCLDKLEDSGEIVSGNFNKSHYDRTKWYSLSCQMDLAQMPNGNGSDAKPIPYNKPDSKQDSNIDTSKFNFRNSLISYGFDKDLVSDWLEVRKGKRASNTKTAYNSFIKEIEARECNINEILEHIIIKSWVGFKWSWYDNEMKSNTNNTKQQKQDEITRIVTQFRIEEERNK